MTITETERLIIREFTTDDFHDLNVMNINPDVTKYILGRPFTPEENKTFLQSYLEFYKKKTGQGVFAATTKTDLSFIGWVCLRPFSVGTETEIGYRLNPKSWGQGYATELAVAMVDYGFGPLHLQEIMAIVNPKNEASKHVLSKAGLNYIKNIDYKISDSVMDVEYWKVSN